jgi:hypothetical protein
MKNIRLVGTPQGKTPHLDGGVLIGRDDRFVVKANGPQQSCIICALHLIFVGRLNQESWHGRTYSIHEGKEEASRKRPLWRLG